MMTWQQTDDALGQARKQFDALHDSKPAKTETVALAVWNAEHRKVELQAIAIGAARYALVDHKRKET